LKAFFPAMLMLLLTGLAEPAWAIARVTLEVNTQKLTTDDELRVTVRGSGTFDEMTEPNVEGWEIHRTGQQQQLSVIGGSMQRTETLMYTATPSKAGTYKFGPVVLLDNNEVVAKSEVVNVEVVATRAVEDVQPPERATELNNYAGNAFFVHPSLSTNQPFVGQPIVVTYTLYWSRQRAIAGIKPLADPSYGRVEAESLRDNTMLRPESVVLAGHPYQRQATHRDLLVAATPGPLRLEGPRFRIETLDARAQKVAPPTIELQVRPIPVQGRPPGFVDGNVGRLHIAGTIEAAGGKVVQQPGGRLEVQTGERVSLTVTASGDGNLLGLHPPVLPQVPGMTAEIVQKRDDAGITRTANGIQGKRTWQWMLSFDRPGHLEVPQVPWASFDPLQERFDVQAIGPFTLDVRGAALAAANTAETAEGETPATPRAVHATEGLHANATEAKLAASDGRSWTQSRLFHVMLTLPWLIALGTLVAYGVRRRKEKDAPELQRRNALPNARTRLRETATSEPGQGYATARQIVAEYLREVARLEIGGLTEPAVVEELQRRQLANDVARQLAADLQHCDFGRFAPAGDRQSDLAQTTERLAQHLTQIDAVLLRSPLPGVAKAILLLALAASAMLPQPCRAATLDEAFARANQAYAQRDFAKAKAEYASLLGHDLPAAAVHYNLGNTLVQLGQLGRAVAQYQVALQLRPEQAQRADIVHNLAAVRAELTDRARRHHATLHVFDESASLDVMFAQSAPRSLLGVTALLAGLLASALLAWQLLGHARQPRGVMVAIAVLGTTHVASLATLLWADAAREDLVQAVVVEEDAQLTACQGQGEAEDLGLPEGLELRKLAEMADGRVRVRLPNGREGCLPGDALEVETPGGQ
jgi:tetratricopeptide (TPR) repeat protein